MPSPPFGAGFRAPHFDEIVGAGAAVDWFEVLSDNFIGVGGQRRAMLARLRADHPIALHGVGLSIAASEDLSHDYLNGLRELAAWLEPAWVSDHLCWTSLGGHQSHDLLPVAYTAAVLGHVAGRVARVQERLGRRLLLENPSAYVAFREGEIDEAEFFVALCRRTGCGMLLDVNNLYVNAANLGIDAAGYLATLEGGVVGYMHLAGHAVLPDVRIDTHDADVIEPVWELFGRAVARFPTAGVIIERDDNLPSFAGLVEEVDAARVRHATAIAGARQAGGIARGPGTGAKSPLNEAGLMLRQAQHERGNSVRTKHSARPELVEGRVECLQRTANQWPEVQDKFWTRVVDKPVGFDHGADAGLGDLLDDGRPVAAARGMRVYSDAYTTNLRRALAVNFPALARVTSAADFGRLAAAYLGRHPPRGQDFRRLGAHLPDFVRSYVFATDYGVDARALGDLVCLEQAQLEVMDEIDEEALAPASLAAVAPAEWEGARVGFVRALRLLRASYDVLPAVEAVARDETPERPRAASVAYLVYRTEGKVHTERLGEREATVLESLAAGRTFGSACATAGQGATDDVEVATDAARALVMVSARGLLRTLELRQAG